MKNFIVIFITLLLFALHFIPVYMYLQPSMVQSAWGMLYIPIFVMDILWGCVLYVNYFDN